MAANTNTNDHGDDTNDLSLSLYLSPSPPVFTKPINHNHGAGSSQPPPSPPPPRPRVFNDYQRDRFVFESLLRQHSIPVRFTDHHHHPNIINPILLQQINQLNSPSPALTSYNQTSSVHNKPPKEEEAEAEVTPIIISSDDQNDNNNNNKSSTGGGRIRSLPHQKNGPYICPKCSRDFVTSQSFASHVGAQHYRNETVENRRNRQINRRSRPVHLQIQHLQDGLITLTPAPPPAPTPAPADGAATLAPPPPAADDGKGKGKIKMELP